MYTCLTKRGVDQVFGMAVPTKKSKMVQRVGLNLGKSGFDIHLSSRAETGDPHYKKVKLKHEGGKFLPRS
jgi:hypothetical protein